MDIISLSKANKQVKDKNEYRSKFLGEGVEAHFSSLDERLDWLEGQFSSSQVKEILNLLTKDAEMDNVEFVDGNLVLKHTPITHVSYTKDYVMTGTFKKVYDLGDNFISMAAQAFLKNVSSNQVATIQYEQSEDGVTYDAPIEWSATTYPNKRYIRVVITLTSNDRKNIDYVTNPELESNEFIQDKKLIKSKSYDMIKDSSWLNEGSLHRKKVSRDELLRIDKIEVK